MIDAKKEIADYIDGKKSVTTGFWIFAALATTFVIVVSGYVNWSAGFARGQLLGGLIAIALDVALVTMGLRSWRGHNWFQTLVDWLCIITLMIVGITCVALYFGIENNRAQYDMNMDLNNALLSTVSGNSATATRAIVLENNAQVRSIAKLVKAPPPKETKTFESLARFVGIDNPEDATFLFNMFMGVALVISSVLMSTRVNSYYSTIQLNQLANAIKNNNAAISRALKAPTRTEDTATTDTDHTETGTEADKETGGSTVRTNKDDKFNDVSDWIATLKDGDNIGAKELKNKSRLSDSELPKLKNRLIKEGVIDKKKHGSSWRYSKKAADKNANIFAMKN